MYLTRHKQINELMDDGKFLLSLMNNRSGRPETNNTNQSNVDKNVFPSFCRNCGVRLIDKPYWCNYCGTQIRAKREWYCAVCGDHLNEQKNFNSESGCWVCLKCKSINRVKEHFY